MWKEALKLALFEWKIESFKRILNQVFLVIVFLVLVYATIDSVLEEGGMGLDFIYFSIFAFGYAWISPKEFQYQKISSDTYASPVFFMLHKLPIKNDVLIRSRFILFFINTIPVLVLLFIGLYFFTDFKEVLSTQGYLAYTIFWSCLGLTLGAVYPASDAGDRDITNTKMAFITIALITSISLIILPTYIFYDDGLVNLTIELANKWPIPVSIISLLVVPIAILYWIRNAKKKVETKDFEI